MPGVAEAQGYGWRHQKARMALAPAVEAGATRCTRCKRQILPGQFWDLDHTDDRSGYLGPAHRSCNRRAGAIKGNGLRGKGARGFSSEAW